MTKKFFDLTKTETRVVNSNRIRNTRQYVTAVLKSNFGVSQVKKGNPFALAFADALNN